MELERFWTLVAAMRADSDSMELHYRSCDKMLKKLSNQELVEFSIQISLLQERAYDWNLWAAAYIINGGCSDDGFVYFRTGLIFQGKEVFEAALADPESLVEIDLAPELIEYESFAYLPEYVFEEKNPDRTDFYDLTCEQLRLPEENSPRGEEWEEDDSELKKRFPKLTEKYGLA